MFNPQELVATLYEEVGDMHEKFNLPRKTSPGQLSDFEVMKFVPFRQKFLMEELDEMIAAKDLESFIDGNIDLAYVALGTLWYFGLKIDENTEVNVRAFKAYNVMAQPQKRFAGLRLLIENHVNKKYAKSPEAMDMCRSALVYLAMNMISTLAAMGFDPHTITEMWNRVHEANMAKELASKDNPSSRGNTSGDLIKPQGWLPPTFGDLFED